MCEHKCVCVCVHYHMHGKGVGGGGVPMLMTNLCVLLTLCVFDVAVLALF